MGILFFILFVLVSLVYFVVEWDSGVFTGSLKVLLMPLLILAYCMLAKPVYLFMVLGLVAGFVGDVALLVPDKKKDKTPLMTGLGAFLMGHIFYTVWFLTKLDGVFLAVSLLWLLPLAVAGFELYFYLSSCLGDMKVPVLVYEFILLIMCFSACLLFVAHPNIGTAFIWAGSICFLVSDAMLAEKLFVIQRKHSAAWIMALYTTAQFLIALGAVIANI